MRLSVFFIILTLISVPLHGDNELLKQSTKKLQANKQTKPNLIKDYLYHRKYQFITAIGGLTAFVAYLLYQATKTDSANDNNQNNPQHIGNNQEESQNNAQKQNTDDNQNNLLKQQTEIEILADTDNNGTGNTNIIIEANKIEIIDVNKIVNKENEENIEMSQQYFEIAQEKISNNPNKVKNLFEKRTKKENEEIIAQELIENLKSGDYYFCKNILDFKNNQDTIDLSQFDDIVDQEKMNLAYLIQPFPVEILLKLPFEELDTNIPNSEYISIIPIILNFLLQPDTNYDNEVVSTILHLLKREIEIEGQRFKEKGQTLEQIAEQWLGYFLLIENDGHINYCDFTINQFVAFTRIMFIFQQTEKQFLSSNHDDFIQPFYPFSEKLKMLLLEDKNISTNEYISMIPTILRFLLTPDNNYGDEVHSVILNLLETEIVLEHKRFKEKGETAEQIAHRWVFEYFALNQRIDCSHLTINQFVILVRMFFCEHEEPHLSSLYSYYQDNPVPLCRFFAKELIGLLLPNKEKNIEHIKYLLENLYPLEYLFNLNQEVYFQIAIKNPQIDRITTVEQYEKLCNDNKLFLNKYFSELARFYNNQLDKEIKQLKERFLPKKERDPKENRHHSEKEISYIIDWLNRKTYHLQQTEIDCCTDFTKLFYVRFNDLPLEIGKILWKTLIKEKDINIVQEKFNIALAGLPFYKKNETLGWFLFFFTRNFDLYFEYFIDQETGYKNELKNILDTLDTLDTYGKYSELVNNAMNQKIFELITEEKKSEIIKKLKKDLSIKIDFIKNLNDNNPFSILNTFKEISLKFFIEENSDKISFFMSGKSAYDSHSIYFDFFTQSEMKSFSQKLEKMFIDIVKSQCDNNTIIRWGIGNRKIHGVDWSKTHIAENLEHLQLKDTVKSIITNHIIQYPNYSAHGFKMP